MEEKWKQFRIWAIIISVCMTILGALLIIWPDISAVAVCCVLGILFILTGIYDIVRYFQMGFLGLFFRHDLALGILNILVGILLLLHPRGAANILPVIAGICLVTVSIFDIQASVEMRRLRIGNWLMSLILGIISTIFAFFLILPPFGGVAALMIYMGILLIVGSVQNFYVIHCISMAVKASKDGNIIDVTWSYID